MTGGVGETGWFNISLPNEVKLKAGHYWVSVQVNCSYTSCGERGWDLSDTIHNNPAVWQQPGEGFGVGCATWGTLDSCFGYSGDLMFDVKGRE